MRARLLASAALALLPSIASAGETVTYSYDAKGRLTKVAHAGGRNDGATTSYAFDAADNRMGVATSGVHPQVIVVPLNGMTVIPLGGN